MPGKLTVFESRLFVLACLLSFATSLWVSLTTTCINFDGILYVSVAEYLQKGDWAAANRIYNWCFYPWLLAQLSSFLGLAPEISAHLLTAAFATLQTLFFVATVLLLGGRGRVLLWAALLIVFHSAFLQKRGEIIRDHGYWAFYLGAFFFFLRFYQRRLWLDALAWGSMMVTAVLFRVEGLLFVFLLPPIIFLRRDLPWRRRWLGYGQLNLTFVLVVVGLLLLSPSGSFYQALIGRLGDGLELVDRFVNLAHGGLAARAEIIRAQVLAPYAGDFAWAVVLLIPWLILGYKIIVATGYLVLALWAWAIFRRLRPKLDRRSLPLLIWVAGLNFLLLLVFVYVEYFLQKRFVYPLLLVLLLPLPFLVEGLLQPPLSLRQRGLAWFVLLLLILQAGDGLFSLPRQVPYLREAGSWMAQEMPAEATLYTNNPKIYYYSRQMQGYWDEPRPDRVNCSSRMLADRPWQNSDWLALWLRHGSDLSDQQLAAALGGPPLKTFVNARRDRVMIYDLTR